jgi:hypothetical protein
MRAGARGADQLEVFASKVSRHGLRMELIEPCKNFASKELQRRKPAPSSWSDTAVVLHRLFAQTFWSPFLSQMRSDEFHRSRLCLRHQLPVAA